MADSPTKFTEVDSEDGYKVNGVTVIDENGNVDAPITTTSPLTITEDDPGATGAIFNGYHDSVSPAADDKVAIFRGSGEDDAGNTTIYGQMSVLLESEVSGSEEGTILFEAATTTTGALEEVAILGHDATNAYFAIGDGVASGVLTSGGAQDLILNTDHVTGTDTCNVALAAGVGGRVSATGAVTANATSGTAGQSGGITLAAGAPGTATTGTGGAGGGIDLVGADGGATSGVGGTGGAGSDVSISAGAGGDDSEGSAGTGGKGGDVIIGSGQGGTGNTAGGSGSIFLQGLVFKTRLSPAAKTTSTTLTAQEILGGAITASQGASGAATYTTLTGTQLDALFPAATLAVGLSFDFAVTNISTDAAEDVTMAGGVGVTDVGNMVVASNAAATDMSAGTFRFFRTGSNAWELYRIA